MRVLQATFDFRNAIIAVAGTQYIQYFCLKNSSMPPSSALATLQHLHLLLV